MTSEGESRQQSIWEHREPEGRPEQLVPAPPEAPGEPRLHAVNRQQMAWRAMDVEQLIAEDHPARLGLSDLQHPTVDSSPLARAIGAKNGVRT